METNHVWLTGREPHLHRKVCLVRQLTRETVSRKLACHVQTVLSKVSSKLIVQRCLFARVV